MFSRRSLRNVALAEREKRARSRLPPPADFHSPRSTDSSSSFSSASIFYIRPRRRFFRPPPSTNPQEKSEHFAMTAHELWAHSPRDTTKPERADGAGCASLRFAGVECLFVEHSLQSDPTAQVAPVDADLFGIY